MSNNKDQKQSDAKEETKGHSDTKSTAAVEDKKSKPEIHAKTDWFFTDNLREESDG